jgi:hypothetical protein
MFDWLIHIIQIFRPKREIGSKHNVLLHQIIQKQSKLQSRPIESRSIDWFKLSFIQRRTAKKITTFNKFSLKSIPTLRFLKEERIRKERERISNVISSIKAKLAEIDNSISREDLRNSKSLFAIIETLKASIPFNQGLNEEILSRKSAIHELSQIIYKRELERQRRIEEERRKREEEEKKRREAQIKAERELKLRLEHERKVAEERRLQERRAKEAEERRKLQEKENELKRLKEPTKILKTDKDAIKSLFEQNGVYCLYHFTARDNLKSIKEHGGLFSWYYCEKHGIKINVSGGDESSRSLDVNHSLQDYVRLSFCSDHPMAYRVHKDNGASLVLLRIKIDVAFFRDTLFSDINAADSCHTRGGDANFIKNNINFQATKKHYLRSESPDFKPHQAEILVKTFIPLEYIENIEFPDSMNFGKKTYW